MRELTLKERVFIWFFAPVAIAISVFIEEDETAPPRKPSLIDRIAVRLGILSDSDRCNCPVCREGWE